MCTSSMSATRVGKLAGINNGNLPYNYLGIEWRNSLLNYTNESEMTLQSWFGRNVILNLYADNAIDNDDKWRWKIANSGDCTLETYASGAWVPVLTVNNTGVISGTISPTGLTNTNFPYMTASGLADSPLTTDGTDVDNTGGYNGTFINTGHGDVEAYAMNQDLETTDSPTFNNITATGAISGYKLRVEKTTDAELTAAEGAGTFVTNQGSSGEVDLTLYAVSAGATVTFIVEETQNIEINPPSGEAFDLDGVALNADDCVDSDSIVGSKIVATRMKNSAGTWIWSLDSVRGNWVDTGASD